MTVEVFCDHADMVEIKTKAGRVITTVCSACSLDERFCDEPYMAVPGEVMHWFQYKGEAYERQQTYRPALQQIMDERVAKREARNRLEHWLEWERDVFPDDTESISRLETEIARMTRERDEAWP